MRIGIGTSIVGQQVFSAKEYLSDVGGTPTAAYSVDKVVSTYTGSVVEVRRTVSAVTVEADVAFYGDTITLDSAVTITSGSSSATTLGEFVAASGYTDVDSLGSAQDAFVATWYDQAGSNDATQTTAGEQPKIVNAGALVTENGKVALDFDGTDDNMVFTSLGGSLRSIFTAVNPNGNTTTRQRIVSEARFVTLNDNSGYTFEIRGDQVNDPLRLATFDDGLTNIDYNNPTLPHGIYTAIINTTSGNIYINGTNVANGALTMDSNYTNGNINISTFPSSMNIQEIIIYNSDKSALRTDIEGNINGRFSIYP